ncbi:zinc-binding dehydrogenase [Streptomyces sp. CG 926]|uniref:zinc-binding dehydrogenase n=1 Tax=Streptomyces sp. CG 926 TaxID=1882405 RepID=UPI0011B54D79|nr:zinc-binding dehydrogenase [Streptomyces sp. CG 926]
MLIDPTMKGPTKFHLGQVPDPVPTAGKVLVEVKAVPLSAWERAFVTLDDPAALAKKTRKKKVNLGLEFSGVIASDGVRFRKGDRVIGSTHFVKDEKCLSEYVAADEDHLAPIPDDLDFVQAAALPIGAQTALTAMDKAGLKGGSRVLVVGATGGVGVYGVQIAAAAGAEVTGIGGRTHHARLRELGAAHTHYYGDTAVADLPDAFDIVFDLSGTLRFTGVRRKLTPRGSFVTSNPDKDPRGLAIANFTRRTAPFLFVPHTTTAQLTRILDLLRNGRIRPVVHEVFDIADHHAAFAGLTAREQYGRTVIRL